MKIILNSPLSIHLTILESILNIYIIFQEINLEEGNLFEYEYWHNKNILYLCPHFSNASSIELINR